MKRFEEGEVIELLSREYGINASLQALPGYEEQNFRVTTSAGNTFLLKIADETASLPFLEAQIAILQHLAKSDLSEKFQQCIPNAGGTFITHVGSDEHVYYMRLYTFIDGQFWVDQQFRPEGLHRALGSFLGKMDRHLANFSHAGMHRRYT